MVNGFLKASKMSNHQLRFAFEDTGVFCFIYFLGSIRRKDCDVFYLKGITYRKNMAKEKENDKDVLVSRKTDFSFHYWRQRAWKGQNF